ncbi:MAG: O-acetyl-ADP-ribose deacetylase [Candidatus Methanoperedens sp.]|nr:O-acetyl-ADP-ribose deacetylase [Candidatus Methanoperedens sp.]
MQTLIGNTRLILICGDITEQETEAIVNAANPDLMGGGGVDGAIHRKGGPDILKECKIIRKRYPDGLPSGQAVITTGGALKAKKVIHTVGPVWHGGNNKEPQLLADSYKNSLKVAIENGIKTISFPSISTGAYGYPVEKASAVALNAVIGFLEGFSYIKEVRFILHSPHDLVIYEQALTEIIR